MGLKVEQRFLLFWSILGLGGVILIWSLPWQFQLNDDVIMMWLVSGVYTGQPESFAVFIHPILSWCFSKLYTFFPVVNWYPATWFFTMFCSFVVFLSGIWKTQTCNLCKWFFSLFLFTLIIHFLFFLQFTIVASFAVGAGLFARLLKFRQMEFMGKDAEKQYSVFSFFLSDGLILLGALIRMEILFLMIAGIFVLGTLVLKSLPIAKALVLPGIGLVLCFSINQAWIYSNELNHFDKANRLRSSVFDDPILQLRKDAFQERFPDLYSFANGLMDFNRQTDLLEKMETWKHLLDKERFISLSPSFFLEAMTYFVLHERYFCFLMGLLLSFSFINHFRFTLNSLVILLGIMILLSPFFLLKIQIYLTILLVFFVVFLLSNLHLTLKKAVFFPFFTLLLGSASFHSYSFLKNNKKFFREEIGPPVFGSISENKVDPKKYLVGWDTKSLSTIEEMQKGIRFLGWPSLLLKTEDTVYLYLVKRAVYEQNLAYFESFQIKNEFPDYLELEFRK
jgi:hypothetical protein